MVGVHWYHTFWIVIIFNIHSCPSLRIVDSSKLVSYAERGGDFAMRCQYQLEGDTLYSLKWYRDEMEFFRYIPSESPSLTVFVTPGIRVDDSSHPGQIKLTSIDTDTAGTYKCEVSGDGPMFQTAVKIIKLEIADLPKTGPYIRGLRSSYHIGDKINLTCHSGPSRPKTKLNWYINGNAADASLIQGNFQGRSSKLGLGFTLQEKHLERGDLLVKCTSQLLDLYWQSTQVVIRRHEEPLTNRGSRVKGINFLFVWAAVFILIHGFSIVNSLRVELNVL